MASGILKGIRQIGGDFFADVEVRTSAVGTMDITFRVGGPFEKAREQARQALRELGSELVHAFDDGKTLS